MDSKLSTPGIMIAVLAVATAAIHLWLGIPAGLPLFILNGIGYIVLAGLLLAPQAAPYRPWVRLALAVFTLVTIIGWVVVGERSPIAYIDKLIEAALVALLVVDWRAKL